MVTYHIEVHNEKGLTDQYLWVIPNALYGEGLHKIATKFLRKNTRIYADIYMVLGKQQTGLRDMLYVGRMSYTWGANYRPSKVWGFKKPGKYDERVYFVYNKQTKKMVGLFQDEFFEKYVE